MEPDEINEARTILLATMPELLGAERDPKDPARNKRVGASRITGHGFALL
jgi:hypothetical protein